jgi:hypothetical protein
MCLSGPVDLQFIAAREGFSSPIGSIFVPPVDVGYSPGNKRVSRLFPVTTDGAKRRPLFGGNPETNGCAKTLSV